MRKSRIGRAMYFSSTSLPIESISIGICRSSFSWQMEAISVRSSFVRRLLHMDAGFQIFGHAPSVIRMRFPDVDHSKLDVVPVLSVDFVQAHGPVTKWRSSIGTEDEPHRRPAKRRKAAALACALVRAGQHIDLEIW